MPLARPPVYEITMKVNSIIIACLGRLPCRYPYQCWHLLFDSQDDTCRHPTRSEWSGKGMGGGQGLIEPAGRASRASAAISPSASATSTPMKSARRGATPASRKAQLARERGNGGGGRGGGGRGREAGRETKGGREGSEPDSDTYPSRSRPRSPAQAKTDKHNTSRHTDTDTHTHRHTDTREAIREHREHGEAIRWGGKGPAGGRRGSSDIARVPARARGTRMHVHCDARAHAHARTHPHAGGLTRARECTGLCTRGIKETPSQSYSLSLIRC